jgi:hypothetical protein
MVIITRSSGDGNIVNPPDDSQINQLAHVIAYMDRYGPVKGQTWTSIGDHIICVFFRQHTWAALGPQLLKRVDRMNEAVNAFREFYSLPDVNPNAPEYANFDEYRTIMSFEKMNKERFSANVPAMEKERIRSRLIHFFLRHYSSQARETLKRAKKHLKVRKFTVRTKFPPKDSAVTTFDTLPYSLDDAIFPGTTKEESAKMRLEGDPKLSQLPQLPHHPQPLQPLQPLQPPPLARQPAEMLEKLPNDDVSPLRRFRRLLETPRSRTAVQRDVPSSPSIAKHPGGAFRFALEGPAARNDVPPPPTITKRIRRSVNYASAMPETATATQDDVVMGDNEDNDDDLYYAPPPAKRRRQDDPAAKELPEVETKTLAYHLPMYLCTSGFPRSHFNAVNTFKMLLGWIMGKTDPPPPGPFKVKLIIVVSLSMSLLRRYFNIPKD